MIWGMEIAFLTIFKIFQTDSDCLSYRKLRSTHILNFQLFLSAVVMYDVRLRRVKKFELDVDVDIFFSSPLKKISRGGCIAVASHGIAEKFY